MSKRTRRPRATSRSATSRHELRSTIVDAGRRLFRKGGHAAISMRKVAEDVGYTVGALYRYFPDKRTLLLHIWEDDMRYAAEYIRGATSHTSDAVEKVRLAFLSYVRYWALHPDSFRTLFAPVADDFDRSDTPDVFPTSGAPALYLETREHLAAALAGKKRAPRNPDLAVQCLLTAAHGIMALAVSGSHFPWFNLEQMAAVTIDSMLAGWGLIDRPRNLTAAASSRPRPAALRKSPRQKRIVP